MRLGNISHSAGQHQYRGNRQGIDPLSLQSSMLQISCYNQTKNQNRKNKGLACIKMDVNNEDDLGRNMKKIQVMVHQQFRKRPHTEHSFKFFKVTKCTDTRAQNGLVCSLRILTGTTYTGPRLRMYGNKEPQPISEASTAQ